MQTQAPKTASMPLLTRPASTLAVFALGAGIFEKIRLFAGRWARSERSEQKKGSFEQ